MGNITATVTEVLTADRMTAVEELPPAARILGRRWTTDQLYALAARDRKVQHHVEHGAARIALAAHFPTVDTAALRSMVTATMGTIAGTYWMVAALHLAQLAMAHPELLTPVQYGLLLAPLEAAEAAVIAPRGRHGRLNTIQRTRAGRPAPESIRERPGCPAHCVPAVQRTDRTAPSP